MTSKRRLYKALSMLLPLGVAAALWGWRYASYRRSALAMRLGKMPREARGRVDALTFSRVGWLDADKKSSFLRLEPGKRPGILRVGCFGDSFTYGTEAGFDEDFPTLLQAELRAAGRRDVEVVNFGVAGFGFQQSALLWKWAARRYSLDYVVLGPRGFHKARDDTFQHWLGRDPYPVHARHVLDRDGVALQEVVGASPAEREAAYLRFFPPWRYIRFDKRPPAFLACLVPTGRQLSNPFYYLRGTALRREIPVLYRRLVERMAGVTPVLVLAPEGAPFLEEIRASTAPGLRVVDVRLPARFPYLAPLGHYTAAGNALLARQLRCLLARSACRVDVALTEDIREAPRAPALLRLGEYGEVGFDLGGARAQLVVRGPRLENPVRAFNQLAASVVALQSGREPRSLLDAVWLTLPAQISDAMVTLRLADGTTQPLGGLERVAPDVPIWRLRLDNSSTSRMLVRWHDGALELDPGPQLAARLGAARRAALLLDGRTLLRLNREGSRWMALPQLGSFFVVTPEAGFLAPPKRAGVIHLVLRRGRVEHRLPIARWRAEGFRLSPTAPPLR